jgi:predicted lipid-binding transport protein (Tim44 family)
MGDFPHYFDIILFAMVAAFLVLRLRSVLGRRTGNERRPDTSFVRRPQAPADPPRDPVLDKVVPLGNRTSVPPPLVTTTPADAVATGLGASTARIRVSSRGLLEGARIAFETIVGSFGRRLSQLRPSDDVYKPFASAIDERIAAGETLETRVLQLKAEDIVEAGLTGRLAITVKFVTDQINVLRAHDAASSTVTSTARSRRSISGAGATLAPPIRTVLVATASRALRAAGRGRWSSRAGS